MWWFPFEYPSCPWRGGPWAWSSVTLSVRTLRAAFRRCPFCTALPPFQAEVLPGRAPRRSPPCPAAPFGRREEGAEAGGVLCGVCASPPAFHKFTLACKNAGACRGSEASALQFQACAPGLEGTRVTSGRATRVLVRGLCLPLAGPSRSASGKAESAGGHKASR
eukprot:2904969-Rhodomonas_salina.1